jgi:DNA polymerase delta subunit 2
MKWNQVHTLTLKKLGEERARMVERVLDVRQGELCWVVGTVYMEMGLKPNILDDISKEVHFTLLSLSDPLESLSNPS